jgi:hypothetical protein
MTRRNVKLKAEAQRLMKTPSYPEEAREVAALMANLRRESFETKASQKPR